MRVIALEQQPSSKRGGQELNLLEICTALHERGFSITLICTSDGDLLEKYKDICDQIMVANQFYPESKKNPIKVLKFLLNSIKSIAEIKDFDEKAIIFSNDFSSIFFGYLISLKKGFPLIQYIQLPASPFRFKWRPGLSGVSRSIAVSQATREGWVNLGIPPEKIEVVYNGVDQKKFSPSADYKALRRQLNMPVDKPIILFVGRLNPNKGLEVLIKAFGQLVKQKGIDAHLYIAGNVILEPTEDSDEARKQYGKYLEEMVAQFHGQEIVHFIGHFSQTQMLYQASDVTVVPSIWPDPCPRVVLESLSCGTPVVGSRMGGIPELLQANFKNWIFDAGNSDQLCEILASLVYWRENQPEVGENCRKHVLDNFTPQKMMDEIARILLEVA